MRKRTTLIVIGGTAAVLGVAVIAYLAAAKHTPEKRQTPATTVSTPSSPSTPASNTPSQPPASTQQAAQPTPSKDPSYSISDPSSIWIVVNKQRSLPSSFVPSDLTAVGNGQQMRSEAATAVKNLVTAATQSGISLKYISGYRSYTYQQTVYSGYVKQSGQAAADTFSARPGHSEHQTGLAMDVGNSSGKCDLDTCFGDTPAGQWVAANAYKYGFIIRYQANTTNLTGYQYEPWHLRYVGTWLAQKLHDHPQTLEQYFNLPAATSY